MASISCGTEALMFGSLMMLAPGFLGELTKLGERVWHPLLFRQVFRKRRQNAGGNRDVAELDGHVSSLGVLLDERQQRVGGQCRGFSSVRV